MTRPRKYTVDYFPHLCKQGKTMYIIESRYGNDGYSFWFKLLEILATTDGHYFDANNPIQMEFLGAKTRLSIERIVEIMGLLASLSAIDKDLWENHKIIWCQNLINNVADVYENRTGILPEKPYYDGVVLRQNIDNHNNNPILPDINPQSKVKENKLNNSILKNGKKLRKFPPEYAPLIKQVFNGLKERRMTYTSMQPTAEALAINQLLDEKFTVEQILKAYDLIKPQVFYRDKNLSMMAVRKNIHEVLEYDKSKKQGIAGNRPSGAFEDAGT